MMPGYFSEVGRKMGEEGRKVDGGLKKAQDMQFPDPNQVVDFGKHGGMTNGQIVVTDEECCRWATRQMRQMVGGLKDWN